MQTRSQASMIGTPTSRMAWLVGWVLTLVICSSQQSIAQGQWNSDQRDRSNATIYRPQGVSVHTPPETSQVPPRINSLPSNTSNTLSPPNSNAVQQAAWNTAVTSNNEAASSALGTNAPRGGLPERKSIELKSPSKGIEGGVDKPKSSLSGALTMFFSLTIVICLFLIMAWLFRKSQPASFLKLPGDVVQVMGRTPMAPRQQMYVVRFGNKLLLVSHQPGQTQTLCEITDPDEVQRLAGLCEANMPTSISNSFRDVFKQIASGKPAHTSSDIDPRKRSVRNRATA